MSASLSLSRISPHELPASAPLPARPDPAFDRIAGLAARVLDVPIAAVSLVDRGGQVLPGQVGMGAPVCETRSTPLADSICQHVVAAGSTLVVSDAREHFFLASHPAVVDGTVVAYAGMPLVDMSGKTVGSLCAIDVKARQWSIRDIEVLADLAATCSSELQMRESAELAHDAQQRNAALLMLSETLSDAVTVRDVIGAVSRVAAGSLGGVFGGLATLDESSTTLHHVDLAPTALTHHASLPLDGDAPTAVAVRERRDLFFKSRDRLAAQFPNAAAVLERAGFEAACYLPLQLGDVLLGALTIVWDRPRSFSIQDRALLSGLARSTAQAIQRATLLAERRDVAHALQVEMLPVVPAVDWIELSGRYLAGESEQAGGDWFDAFELPGRELAISVGDVQGHDARAAAVMGRLSSTLRGIVAARPAGPGDVLAALDRVHAATSSRRVATALFGTVRRHDGDDDLFTWSNAGHLPPLVLAPGEPPEFLTSTVDPPVGNGSEPAERHSRSVPLAAGSTVLLFTDGLVERPDEGVDRSLRELAAAADRARHLPLPTMITTILGDLLDDAHGDDVVLLGVRNSRAAETS